MHARTPKAQMPSLTVRTTAPTQFPFSVALPLLLDDNRRETLGVLDVHGLNVAVELLLGALLVVTSARDADAESVWNTLDTLLPDLLVELGVDADIGGALSSIVSVPSKQAKASRASASGPILGSATSGQRNPTYHRLEGKGLDLLDGLGGPLLEAHAMQLVLPSATLP